MFAPPRRLSTIGNSDNRIHYSPQPSPTKLHSTNNFKLALEKDLDRQRRENQMLISRLENIQRRRVEILSLKQTSSKAAIDFDRGTLIPIMSTIGEATYNFIQQMITDRKTSVFQAKELLEITLKTILHCISPHVNEDHRIRNTHIQISGVLNKTGSSPLNASPSRSLQSDILTNADRAKREGLPSSSQSYQTLRLEAKKFYQEKEQQKKARIAKIQGARAIGNFRSRQKCEQWKMRHTNPRENFSNEYPLSADVGIKNVAFWWSRDDISPHYLEELRDARDKKAAFYKGKPNYDPNMNLDSRVKGGGLHFVDQDDNFDEFKNISNERVARRRERGEVTKEVIGIDCNAQLAYTFSTKGFKNWTQRNNGSPWIPAPGQSRKKDILSHPKNFEKVQPVVVLPTNYDPHTRKFISEDDPNYRGDSSEDNEPQWMKPQTEGYKNQRQTIRTSIGMAVIGVEEQKLAREISPSPKSQQIHNTNNNADNVDHFNSQAYQRQSGNYVNDNNNNNNVPNWANELPRHNIMDGNQVLKQPTMVFNAGDQWESPLVDYSDPNALWGGTNLKDVNDNPSAPPNWFDTL